MYVMLELDSLDASRLDPSLALAFYFKDRSVISLSMSCFSFCWVQGVWNVNLLTKINISDKPCIQHFLTLLFPLLFFTLISQIWPISFFELLLFSFFVIMHLSNEFLILIFFYLVYSFFYLLRFYQNLLSINNCYLLMFVFNLSDKILNIFAMKQE